MADHDSTTGRLTTIDDLLERLRTAGQLDLNGADAFIDDLLDGDDADSGLISTLAVAVADIQAHRTAMAEAADEIERLATKLAGHDEGLDRWCNYQDRLVETLDRLGLRQQVLAELERDGWKNPPECAHKAEIDVLRDLLDHAVQSWSPRGTGRAPIFAEWDDTDWADSGWTEPERYELRAAVGRVEPPTSTRGNVRGHR